MTRYVGVTSFTQTERNASAAFLLDTGFILLFAGLGRRTHERDAGVLGLLETAWPFLAALTLGWWFFAGWRSPFAIVRTGLPVWIFTVVMGMVMRVASGSGTALAFVIVATITLGVFLLGWRALLALVRRLRARPREGLSEERNL